MTTKNVKMALKADNSVILEGEWYDKIKADESSWNIDGPSVVFNLEKGRENIWKTVLKGDEEIDTKKVDNSKPI